MAALPLTTGIDRCVARSWPRTRRGTASAPSAPGRTPTGRRSRSSSSCTGTARPRDRGARWPRAGSRRGRSSRRPRAAGRGRASVPWPSTMRCRMRSSHVPPSRHGVHLPHDSWAKKRTSVQRRVGDVGGLVHHDDRAGAEHRAGRADELVLERQVELLGQEPRRRAAAGDERLQLRCRRGCPPQNSSP